MDQITIYALYDPIYPDEIRYIGKTNKKLRETLISKIQSAKDNLNTYTNLWINALINSGRKPWIKQLYRVNKENSKPSLRNTILIYAESNKLTNYNIGECKTKLHAYDRNLETDTLVQDYIKHLHSLKIYPKLVDTSHKLHNPLVYRPTLPYIIYALYDPESPDQYRYVGCTKKSKSERLKEHIYESKNDIFNENYKFRWINALLTLGREPQIKQLRITTEDNWKKDEQEAIQKYLSLGHPLTNHSIGGGKDQKIIGYDYRRDHDVFINSTLNTKPKTYTTQNNGTLSLPLTTQIPNIPGLIRIISKPDTKKKTIRYYAGDSLSCKYADFNIQTLKITNNTIFSDTKNYKSNLSNEIPEFPSILKNIYKWIVKYEEKLLDFIEKGYLWDQEAVGQFINSIKTTNHFLDPVPDIIWPSTNVYKMNNTQRKYYSKFKVVEYKQSLENPFQQSSRSIKDYRISKFYKPT